MKQPCYVTAKDYAYAIKQKRAIIEVLRKSKSSLMKLGAKMPDYWHDSCGDVIQIELINEIEELIKELKHESS
tara:strand:+ start:40 stop:258 length:219 start_codon:yes stop_codon:yes gene_type:complete